MRKETSYKIIAVVALILGIVGLSIGFAAFSKTLNISSATVSTTTRTNVFETAIHYDTSWEVKVGINLFSFNYNLSNATVENRGTLTTDTWSDISFTINADSNTATVPLVAKVLNDSTEYDAYLKEIKSTGTLTCTAVGETNQDLVDQACTKMVANIIVAGYDSSVDSPNAQGNGYTIENAQITSTSSANANVSRVVKLFKNNDTYVGMYFVYNNDGVLPDGEFRVTIPSITFSYTSVIPSGN